MLQPVGEEAMKETFRHALLVWPLAEVRRWPLSRKNCRIASPWEGKKWKIKNNMERQCKKSQGVEGASWGGWWRRCERPEQVTWTCTLQADLVREHGDIKSKMILFYPSWGTSLVMFDRSRDKNVTKCFTLTWRVDKI